MERLTIPADVMKLVHQKLEQEEVPDQFKKTVKEVNSTVDIIFPVRGSVLLSMGRVRTADQIDEEFYNPKDI